MPINYNPKDYLLDFSWVGEMGNHFAKVAEKIPSLMELNKSIREDRMMKEKAQSQFTNYIQNYEGKELYSLAVEMGLNPENEADAKQKIIDKIPSFDDKTKNEEYVMKIANSFLGDLVGAGNRLNKKEGTDRYSQANILGGLYGTDLGVAGQQTTQAQEQRALELDQEKTANRLEVENEYRQKYEQQTFDTEQVRGQKDADVVGRLVSAAGNDPLAVFSDTTVEGATLKQKTAAYKAILDNNTQILSTEARRAASTPKPKEFTPAQIDSRINSMNTVASVLLQKLNKLAESKDGEKSAQYREMANQRAKILDNIVIWENARNRAEQEGLTTQSELQNVIGQERTQRKIDIASTVRDLAQKYAEGGFKGGIIPWKTSDDKARFYNELVDAIPGAEVKWSKNIPTVSLYGEDITQDIDSLVREQQSFSNPTQGSSIRKSSTTSKQTPKVGDVIGGYEFLGGNPAEEKSWKKVQ